jgi:hypothetical protein
MRYSNAPIVHAGRDAGSAAAFPRVGLRYCPKRVAQGRRRALLDPACRKELIRKESLGGRIFDRRCEDSRHAS